MEISREELKEIIKEAIEEADIKSHQCRIPLSDEAIEEIDHFFGMLKDHGNDKYSAGIEKMRKDLAFASKLRSLSGKAGERLVMWGLVGFFAFLAGLAWFGFSVKMGGVK